MSNVSALALSITNAEHAHFASVYSWFSHPRQVLLWAGPSFSYPCELRDFIKQLTNNRYQSYAILQGDELVGFGQYQLHQQHVHLGRVAVNPKKRGQGLSYKLMNSLLDTAQQAVNHDLKSASLFVFEANRAAYNCYKNLGFVKAKPPPNYAKLKGCDYMLLRI